MKFGNKRFSGFDYDDGDIKWPELKADNDGTGAAMQPLPARRTGGAGFDMGEGSDDGMGGDEEKYGQRNSFSGSTTALSAAPPAGYTVNGAGYTPSGYDAPSSMQTHSLWSASSCRITTVLLKRANYAAPSYAHDGGAAAAQQPAYLDQHYAHDSAQHAFVDPYGRTTSPPGLHNMVDQYGNQRM
ncbi:hypothetical protein U1Q18_052096 [Sarracenia purpurea var. burkii]